MERDIHVVSKAFNHASDNDVKAHAATIYDGIQGVDGTDVPPPPPREEGPWPQSRIELFAKWMADGYQRSMAQTSALKFMLCGKPWM
jgi:hypothetical protein